jgi:hypothetical protein
MYLNYTDPNQVTDSNPQGKVRWVEINFVELNMKCEVSSRTQKGLVRLIYENDLYADGKLDLEKVQRFVNKYGMRFSGNRPSNNVNVIINN